MPTNETNTPEIEPAWDSILEELGIPPEPPAQTASTSQPPTPTVQTNTPGELAQPSVGQPDSVVVSVTTVSVTTTSVTATPAHAASQWPDDSATTSESAHATTQPARLTTLNDAEEPIGFDKTDEPEPDALPAPVGDKNQPASRRQRVKVAPVESNEPFGGGLVEDLPPPVEPLTVAVVSDEEVATFAWSEPVSNEPETDTEIESIPSLATTTPNPLTHAAGTDAVRPSGAEAMEDSELEPSQDAAEDSTTEIDEATDGEVAEPGNEPTKSKRRRRRRRSRKKKKGGQQPTTAPVEADDATDTPDTADLLGFAEAGQSVDAAGEARFGDGVAGETEQLAGTANKQTGHGKQRRQKGQKHTQAAQSIQAQPTELDDPDDDATLAHNPAFLAGEDTSKYSEELLQTLRNWNVPSWNEVIAGLYRPER